MKIQTKDLKGICLDYAAVMASDSPFKESRLKPTQFIKDWDDGKHDYGSSSSWAMGLVRRHNIAVIPGALWGAVKGLHTLTPTHFGDTPELAIWRCFIAFKLGDEVEIPDEIVSAANP